MKFGIGQPVRRYEDLRLITGRGRYTDDVSPPRTTHAFVLRSPVAHAHLRRVDAAAALQMPGVLFVATGAEVQAEGLGNLACQTPLNNSDGTPRHDTPRPLLAIGKVRYVGQPVALVVAETLSQARDAAEAIEVDYEALPVVTEAKDALTPGAAQLFDHIPGNLVLDWDNDLGDPKATAAAFAKASHIVGLDLVNNRLVANSMEPRNAVADFDPQSGRSTLYTGTQGPHFVRDPLAEAVLKIPKEQLRVITPNVGGGFGMKAFVYPEQALAVWASRKIARPVKWQEDRSEGFISDNQGRDHTTHAELALDAAGRFLGLRVTTLANLGAYLSPFGAFVPTRSSDLVSGLYMIGAVHVNVKGVCTNTVPVCAYRGAGRPEAAYLLERIVDAAARELRLTPDAIRRVNFVPASRDPARLPADVEPGLDATHHRVPPAQTFPNGCHIVEVEIDPDTGCVAIDRYTIVDDFGRTINPLLLEGQVHGGIVQGIGQALLEHAIYDEDSGQLLAGSFMDYAMPRAGDVPAFAFSTHNVPSTSNPFGVKGAGEAGSVGAPPAVINAIVDHCTSGPASATSTCRQRHAECGRRSTAGGERSGTPALRLGARHPLRPRRDALACSRSARRRQCA
jgi:CO/xanthine dehydrogenase Mo-binding subunit